jgi:hypothetical protein
MHVLPVSVAFSIHVLPNRHFCFNLVLLMFFFNSCTRSSWRTSNLHNLSLLLLMVLKIIITLVSVIIYTYIK